MTASNRDSQLPFLKLNFEQCRGALGVIVMRASFSTLITKSSGTDLRRLKLGFYREWERWLMLEAAQLDGDLASQNDVGPPFPNSFPHFPLNPQLHKYI